MKDGELLKPDPIPCPCGCGKYGREPKQGAHVKRCVCSRCKAGRQRPLARRREDRIARGIRGVRDSRSGALSGWDVRNEVIAIEETSNEALVKTLRRWWGSKGIEEKMVKVRQMRRLVPVAFVASWDDKPQVAVLDYEDFEQLVRLAQDGGRPPDAA